ncbi:hypothetical protein [Ammoniphilus sp. 3BR4]|uniref:hypothetical protein n=1 Tax=Ammoniphilus sp. 3BR4 TaxID=3158265 RepID=UPI0034674730
MESFLRMSEARPLLLALRRSPSLPQLRLQPTGFRGISSFLTSVRYSTILLAGASSCLVLWCA